MVPHERSLVKRLEGRPFVLLGVNKDDSRDELRKVMSENQIPWRSWWDGKGDSPAVRDYRVDGYPAIVLIDSRGRVRKRWDGAPRRPEEIDEAVDQLLKEREQDPNPVS
jgi:hypothetical protein